MKIIKVLVDELPKSCAECELSREIMHTGGMECSADHSICFWMPHHKRQPWCPLALEHDNAKIANEVM